MRSDAELVWQVRSGHREAFGVLIARYEARVYAYCRQLLDNSHEAQDATQDAFLRAYSSLHQLERPDRFAGWLRQITFSICINRLKTRRPRTEADFGHLDGMSWPDLPDVSPGPAEEAQRRELKETILKAIDTLPPAYRDPIRMSYLQHASRAEIAESLGLTPAAVSTRLFRARKLLKEEILSFSPVELMTRSKERRRWLPSNLTGKETAVALLYQTTTRRLLRGDAGVSIRAMTREDIPALRKYDQELTAQLDAANAQVPPGRESHPGGPWADDEWLAEHFDKYAKRGNITLLAEDNSGKIVGFADLWVAREPAPFGTSLDVECIDYFREYYYLGLENVLLEEAEKVARAAGLPALDIGTNTSSGDYPSLRRLGMKVFYEYDNVCCRCQPAATTPALKHRVLKPEDVDLTGLIKVSHWSPTDFTFRDEGWIAELIWDSHRAVLELWCHDPGSIYDLPVPEHAPTHSELYAEPQALSSPSQMSIILSKCASLAGELGAREIPLPCPSDLDVDPSQLDAISRDFAFAWMRKRL